MHLRYTQISLFALLISIVTISCGGEKTSTQTKSTEPSKEQEEPTKAEHKPTILFFGNSLTAGYGLEPEQSFPSLIEDMLVSAGYDYTVVNAGLSGETTSGGLNRIDWVLNQKVDIFFLELGANDMLRGLPVEETIANLTKIIKTVQAKYPAAQIAICQMLASPNMGAEYEKIFNTGYSKIAKETGAKLVPFFLEGVVGHPDLILPDGKHPNANGQKVVAANIWKSLEPMLK